MPVEAPKKIVELNIGGHYFTSTLQTLTRYPTSRLAEGVRHPEMIDARGRIFFDRDGTDFALILEHCRGQPLPKLEPLRMAKLQRDAENYALPSLTQALCQSLAVGTDAFGERTVLGKLERVAALLHHGDYDTAIEHMYSSYELDERALENVQGIDTFFARGRHDWAVQFVEGLLRIKDESPHALRPLERAFALNPEALCVRATLAQACMRFGKPERAEALAADGLAKHPDSWEMWCRLAQAQAHQARSAMGFHAAAQSLERAIWRAPDTRRLALWLDVSALWQRAGESSNAAYARQQVTECTEDAVADALRLLDVNDLDAYDEDTGDVAGWRTGNDRLTDLLWGDIKVPGDAPLSDDTDRPSGYGVFQLGRKGTF